MNTTYDSLELKSAIARSISHTERVTVECDDIQQDLERIDNMEGVEDLDSAKENDGSLDVWGLYQGSDFRLLLTLSAASVLVIDDGQVKFPVRAHEYRAWVEANGKLTESNYEQFCDSVKYVGQERGLVGSQEIIDLCDDLQSRGASVVRVE